MVGGPLERHTFYGQEGRGSMTGQLLYLVLGLGLLFCFLILGVRGRGNSVPDSRALNALRLMVRLDGLSFAHLEFLLDDADYQLLRSESLLAGTAKRLRRDRRDLAIMWMDLLVSDLKELWRFRRFLVRRGVAAGFDEEVRIYWSFVFSILLLRLVKLFIRCFGPFALRRATRRAAWLAEVMTHAPAHLLSRLPSETWSDIEQSWARTTA